MINLLWRYGCRTVLPQPLNFSFSSLFQQSQMATNNFRPLKKFQILWNIWHLKNSMNCSTSIFEIYLKKCMYSNQKSWYIQNILDIYLKICLHQSKQLTRKVEFGLGLCQVHSNLFLQLCEKFLPKTVKKFLKIWFFCNC